MISSRARTLLALAVAAAAAAPALAQPKTVNVDCTKGQSVQDALSKKGNPLTIVINGICVENVTVRRDNLIFEGADPALDGIRAASTTEDFGAAVIVRESRNIHFQSLQFAGGRTSGLRVENARRNISADDCLFHDNGTWGVIAVGGVVSITNSTSRDNHTLGTSGGGLIAAESGQLICDGCTVVDNPDPTDGVGAASRTGGIVSLVNTTIDGVRTGAAASLGGEVFLSTSDVTGDVTSLIASDHSTILIDSSTLAGTIFLTDQSRLTLFDVVQTTAGGFNTVDNSSVIEIFTTAAGATAFADDLRLGRFSQGSTFGAATFTDILCTVGSDFSCDGAESKTSSTCGLCP